MDSAQLLENGLELMTLGMGTVFTFLTLLVLCTSFMSWLILRYFPDSTSGTDSGPTEQDDNVVAVISAAIAAHRARR